MENWLTPQMRPILLTCLLAGLVGVMIYLVFSTLRRFLPSLIWNPRRLGQAQEVLPLVETGVWILFVALSLGYLITPNPLMGLVIAGILTTTLWHPLRNLFSGLVLRISRRYRPGQRISTGALSGVIVGMGPLTIELEGTEGERIVIPYHQISTSQVIRESPSDQVKRFAMDLYLPRQQPVLEAELALRRYILTLPWTVTTRAPKVTLLSQDEQGMAFRLVLYAFHSQYFPQMEQCLRQYAGQVE